MAGGVSVATVPGCEGCFVLSTVPILVLWLFGQATVQPDEERLHRAGSKDDETLESDVHASI